MVVERYDGSLKAEHGTGRNIAPFVELEWGARGVRADARDQAAVRPRQACSIRASCSTTTRKRTSSNLKPLPACDPLVDKCIECGFCEPKCPSHGLTLSPRQRIVGWREIARLERDAADAPQPRDAAPRSTTITGIDTCAACGLCATACPVGIETGILIKALRGRRAGPLAHRVADVVAGNFGAVTAGVRVGLGVADLHCTGSSARAR